MNRPSVIAGTWYPGDAKSLRSGIDTFFSRVPDSNIKAEILGLISPHAGYAFSGQTAAFGYKSVQSRNVDTVVILSPNHQLPLDEYMVSSADTYETPLGRVPLDRDFIRQLGDGVKLRDIDLDGEHSIEIQLPFLQVVFKNFMIVPIMIGHGDVFGGSSLVNALAGLLKDRNYLMIASTDLHHIPDYEAVRKSDAKVIDALEKYDMTKIRQVLSDYNCTVCGKVPICIVLETLQRLGAKQLINLNYTTSGDVTGDKRPGQYTVGYLSSAII